jgi:peptidyl-prolyl cis-trans isomerase B (cyclophilin B)
VAGSAKRERQLAREHYERQQARRAEAATRRRRWQQITAVVCVVLLLGGGAVGLALLLDDDETATAKPQTSSSSSAQPSPSASPSVSSAQAGGCTYTKTTDAAKDVGVPTYSAKKARQPYTATIKTSQGDVVVKMASAKAPCTANSFRFLASKGYYDGTKCHRLTTSGLFVLQCGDPTGTGGGGPGYQFGVENAPETGQFPAGTVAMARANDPGSNGSQFFIVYDDTQLPTNTGGYTIFGTVTEGLDVVKKVAEAGVKGGGADGAPAEDVVIESVQVGKA